MVIASVAIKGQSITTVDSRGKRRIYSYNNTWGTIIIIIITIIITTILFMVLSSLLRAIVRLHPVRLVNAD